jgi:NAD(P)-dependent dehydrogenase (short-subunit alcohol dehydrogenase family)
MPPPPADRPRTALVAGGTGALGRAVVDVLLERGERVAVPYVADHEADALRAARAAEIDAGRLRLSRSDVTDPDALAALLDVATADWGPLWLACSTAGGFAGGDTVEGLDDLGVLEAQLRLNLRTAFVVAREGLRHMGPAGGRVVLVGSRVARRPVAGQAAYAVSKAAVHTLVETLAVELRGSGRTANAVVPTIIDTPGNRAALPDADRSRWVPPRALAEVIAWLGSPEAWAVSGALIPVPGDGN